MLGIKFGNSTIVVHHISDTRSERNAILPLTFQGKETIPSYVMIQEEGSVEYGIYAKHQIVRYPSRVIFGVKHLIGHKYHDCSVQKLLENVGFEIQPDEDDNPLIVVDGKKYIPEEILGFLLEYVKDTCKSCTGQEATDCVITVPAYFNSAQRNAVKTAARIANLNVCKFLSEPTAAAIAYYNIEPKDNIHLLVFDFGAGTLDVSIVYIDGRVFIVKAVAGNSNLGGADIDKIIADHCIEQFQPDFNPKDPNNKKSMVALLQSAEEAKIALSSKSSSQITIPNFYNGQDLTLSLSAMRLNSLIRHKILDQIPTPIHSALKAAGLKPTNIDGVLLVGGSSMIPAVKEKLEEIFPGKIYPYLNSLKAVSDGAATICQKILNDQLKDFEDVKDYVNPGTIAVVDVQPISIGIKTVNDTFQKFINANEPIPQETQMEFKIKDTSTFTIEIYQGESTKCSENVFLRDVTFMNIPRECTKVFLKIAINNEGMLVVEATDPETQYAQTFDFCHDGKLNDEMVQEIIRRHKAANETGKKKAEEKLTQVYDDNRRLKCINKDLFREIQNQINDAFDEIDDIDDSADFRKFFELADEISKKIRSNI
ncbi:dnaK protein [Trichomonas vaginalis G3]|uniref:DnaK protein n=1 Tax=Trichomonas vaginalis (strain ATCC PRA-98 / G3) TaxID=412133 RepID=A2EWU7_TRIV3|nr:ATP binding [Trichomonas vaginalis G3]EAY02862.1 dnaK protein [Trichomonas vaginalis G3]KAI5497376.1 ATP binding [Trichomonas vaginalis G3]|eukprot:XP_001315085.1 dnaK protein [Trichomonas vaginalis G3]